MKKVGLFVALFVLPILTYLFFASGINDFMKLPIVTEQVRELPQWKTLSEENENPQLKNKITILGFTGSDISSIKGNLTNLAHKIYSKNKDFVDFQVVYVAPNGLQSEILDLLNEMQRTIDMKNWYFVFATNEEILSYYNQLHLVGNLSENTGTTQVYIIDKELNLRGRKGKNKKGEEEYREGYNTASAADLHNEMADDVKVILAEYRAALKKNNRKDNITE